MPILAYQPILCKMKILKYLLFLLLIVIIGGAVYFGTKDGSFDISSKRTIEAPKSLVLEQINDFKNWEAWGPWKEQDTAMQINYGEKTVGEGASYSWKSETEGDGAMETVKVIRMDTVLQNITFNTPIGDSSSDVYWYLESTDQGATEVTWGMKGEQSFLEKVFMSFQEDDFDTMLRSMFDKGLENIDEQVKDAMSQYDITVEGIKEYGGGYYMFTTAASKISELGAKMGPMLGKVSIFMQQNNIPASGMPFTLYNEWDDTNGTTIFSTAIPVKEKIIVTQGDVLCGYMEPLSAVKTILKGNYDNLGEAHQKAMEYIQGNNLLIDPSNPPFEVYANDPGEVPNPAEWITEIYYPVFKDLTSNHPIISGNNQ